jgi:hypothetical protein
MLLPIFIPSMTKGAVMLAIALVGFVWSLAFMSVLYSRRKFFFVYWIEAK